MKRRSVLMLVFLGLSAALLPPVVFGGDESLREEVPTFSNKDLDKYKSSSDDDSQGGMNVDERGDKIERIAKKEEREKEYWCKRASPHSRKIEKARDEVKEAEDLLAREKDKGLRTTKKSSALKKRLEKAEKRLKYAERDLRDLEDEAHRKGIPPGWLRCQSD